MSKYFLKFVSMSLLCISSFWAANAQVVIKVRPGAPVVRVRPACPGPGHVWVYGDYAWRGNQYIYKEGYWVVPPYRHQYWKEGHWKRRRGGWVWIQGHWI